MCQALGSSSLCFVGRRTAHLYVVEKASWALPEGPFLTQKGRNRISIAAQQGLLDLLSDVQGVLYKKPKVKTY